MPVGWLAQAHAGIKESGSRQAATPPADPFARPEALKSGASKPVWKTSREILESQGVSFPAGASARFDPGTGTLTVTSTAEDVKIVGWLVDEWQRADPLRLSLALQMVEVPLAEVEAVMEEARQDSDASQSLARLMTSKDKAVKPLAALQAEAASGQKLRIKAAIMHEHVEGVDNVTGGGQALRFKTLEAGLVLEAEMFLPAYDSTASIDLDIGFGFDSGPPVLLESVATQPAAGQAVRLHGMVSQGGRIHTSLGLKSGSTRLLGVWRPDGEIRDGGRRWLAFVTAHNLAHGPGSLYSSGDLVGMKAPQDMWVREFALPCEWIGFDEVHGAAPAPQPYLESQAISFPPGSFVRVGPHGQSLVCNTPDNMERISALLDQQQEHVYRRLVFTVHAFQAPGSAVREILKAAGSGDASRALEMFLAKAAKGAVTALGTFPLQAKKGGHTTRFSSGEEHPILADFSIDKEGRPSLHSKTRLSGFDIELTPEMSRDGRLIDLDVQYAHVKASDRASRQDLQNEKAADGSGGYSVWMESFPEVALKTRMMMTGGSAALLGIWPSVDLDGPWQRDLLEVAFVTCDELVLKALPSRAQPPYESVRDRKTQGDPNEMITRTYVVPPDFTSFSGAAGDAPAVQKSKAQEILEGQGISFPAGASAVLEVRGGWMTVTNTRANHQLVEAFVESMRSKTPRIPQLTCTLIEVPGAQAREVVREAARTLDAQSQLQRLLETAKRGTGRVVDVWWQTQKSGQAATFSQGRTQPYFTGLGFDKGLPAFIQESRNVGTENRCDTVVGPDGHTIDFNLTLEHHLSPPVSRTLTVSHPGLGGRADLPVLDFHVSKASCPFVTTDGATTLISTWRSGGKDQDLMQLLFATVRVSREPAARPPHGN